MTTGLEKQAEQSDGLSSNLAKDEIARVGGVYPPVHTSTPKWQKRPRKAGHLARDLASITRETLSRSPFW